MNDTLDRIPNEIRCVACPGWHDIVWREGYGVYRCGTIRYSLTDTQARAEIALGLAR